MDYDTIPDDIETGFGADVGGPYDIQVDDTYTNDQIHHDEERYTLYAQSPWEVGSANDSDWAHPGSQWPDQ